MANFTPPSCRQAVESDSEMPRAPDTNVGGVVPYQNLELPYGTAWRERGPGEDDAGGVADLLAHDQGALPEDDFHPAPVTRPRAIAHRDDGGGVAGDAADAGT